ncbi:MAG: porin [Alphaproteobacteria bacterium]
MKKIVGIATCLSVSVVSFALATNKGASSKATSRNFAVPKVEAPKEKEKEKKLRLEISGKSSFNVISGEQSQRTVQTFKTVAADPDDAKSKADSAMFSLDSSKINFKVFGKSDFGLDYSLHFSLTGDTNATNSVRETYLKFEGNWGSVILGDTAGVEDIMAVGGFDTQVGSGGFDGSFENILAVTTGVKTTVDLPGDTGDATKIAYVTPRLEGVQLGISFAPDTKHDGSAKLNTASHPNADAPVPFDRNSISAGLNYMRELQNGLKLSLSLTGIAGTTRPERKAVAGQFLDRENTRAWAVGGVVEYKNFSFGAEYMRGGKSNQLKTDVAGVDPYPATPALSAPLNYVASKARAADMFNLGVSYAFTPDTKVSLGYYHSERKTGFENHKAKGDVFAGGVEHKVAEGLVVYGEYANHNLKNPSALYEARMLSNALGGAVKGVKNQRANTVILGTRIQF